MGREKEYKAEQLLADGNYIKAEQPAADYVLECSL
jgi:hypothetical protein